jgi:hypothetical protein
MNYEPQTLFVEIRYTLPAVFNPESVVFLKNKANFRKSQMNISSFITSKYENFDIWYGGKNKAKTKPNKANFPAPDGAFLSLTKVP